MIATIIVRPPLLIPLALLIGCGGGPGDPGPDAGPTPSVTYHGAIRPLIETHCRSCHFAGGIAPFALDSPEDAVVAAWAVLERKMPPAQTDPSCRATRGHRWVAHADLEAVARWREEGFPVGNPADYVPPLPAPDPPELGPPNLVVPMNAPYLPDTSVSDDFIELVLDHVFDRTTFVYAAEIVPGASSIVHHAVAFLVDDEGKAILGDRFAQSPSAAFVGYAPGVPRWLLPAGAAFVVPPGARIKLEIHYSIVSVPPGEPVPSDQSQVALWTLPDGERPDYAAFIYSITNDDLLLPAGDSDITEVGTSEYPGPPGTIIGMAPHMHLRGDRFRGTLLPAAGGEICLIDTPNYDFEWQEMFLLSRESFVEIQTGDTVRVNCHYDNSAENQPIIDGVRLPAQDVFYGGDTLDEMCQLALLMIQPYVVSPNLPPLFP